MSQFDELYQLIPVADIATSLGVSEQEAEGAIKQAIPALVGGLAEGAKDESGAATLTEKLQGAKAPEAHASVADIDTEDGDQIVATLLGGKREDVLTAASTGQSNDLIAKLLPLLAPIVLSWLAKKQFGGGEAAGDKKADAGASGGIGDLLGGLLEGAGGAGGLGDLLGGLLGGKK